MRPLSHTQYEKHTGLCTEIENNRKRTIGGFREQSRDQTRLACKHRARKITPKLFDTQSPDKSSDSTNSGVTQYNTSDYKLANRHLTLFSAARAGEAFE
jgi:hypothetical protein